MASRIAKKAGSEPYALRRVPDEGAFYFYRDVGTPLGIRANSLEEFSKRLREVDSTTVRFHIGRHDFENWIKMLGDPILAEQISSLSRQSRTPEKLHSELSKTVESRLRSLHR